MLFDPNSNHCPVELDSCRRTPEIELDNLLDYHKLASLLLGFVCANLPPPALTVPHKAGGS